MITNIILALGIMVVIGFLGGMIAARVRVPRITGYLIAGILLSPSLLNIVPKATVESLNIITSVALGIIAYLIGGSLRISSFRTVGKSVAWITPLKVRRETT